MKLSEKKKRELKEAIIEPNRAARAELSARGAASACDMIMADLVKDTWSAVKKVLNLSE